MRHPGNSTTAAQDRRYVTALARGMDLLHCFRWGERWLPHQELTRRSGLPKATGPAYRIDPSVPVQGYQGQFTVHTDAGDVAADGSDMLRQRVAEVGPTQELQKLSQSDVFVDALAKSAAGGVKAVGRAVTNPVETVKAVPAGVGRFFRSVGESVSSAGDGDAGEATKDALGINKAKRELARKVGVDPYTTNPQLAARLDELANAAFAGGVSIDVALAVSTAGVAAAVSMTKTVSNLAWELPPEDVKKRNDAELAALKVDEATRAKLLGNRWFTPTLALSYVEATKALGKSSGANAFTALAAGAASESEARFFVAQLRLAQRYGKEGDAIADVIILGKVGAFRTASGKTFVAAPLDYLSYSEGVKAFLENNRSGKRVVWFRGKASPATATQLRATGWSVRENVAVE